LKTIYKPRAIAVGLVALSVFCVACGPSATPTTITGPATSTTTRPDATTTRAASSVIDEAEGSGCNPGPGTLGDGEWFGYVVATTESEVEFDLACWFTGEAASRAASEDGEESPPPNDYYVRNENSTIRSQEVADGSQVVWYRDPGDPGSETSTGYAGWITERQVGESMPGVWLRISEGQIVQIQEQWVP
jgi:hypothetical protein